MPRSVTEHGCEVHENFAQLLILETTGDSSLVHLETHPRAWKFFQGESMFTSKAFPADLDTTSLALIILKPEAETIHYVMDEMLDFFEKKFRATD
ncbi:hypothetical protein C8J57DRAFT_1500960 [Mycena rebaudengoi]|nr:hypothetical protein C8J57DRAFT_1500960 [Mycena rebaudengoi]